MDSVVGRNLWEEICDPLMVPTETCSAQKVGMGLEDKREKWSYVLIHGQGIFQSF